MMVNYNNSMRSMKIESIGWKRINWVKGIGLQSQSIEYIKQDLMKAQDMISTEMGYVSNGMGVCIIYSM